MSDTPNQKARRAASVEQAKRDLQASREALMHQMVPSTRSRRPATSQTTQTMQNLSAAQAARVAKLSARAAGTAAGNGLAQDAAAARAIPTAAAKSARVQRAPGSSTLAVVRHAFNAWWQFHPARAMGAIAEPFVEEFAERRPFRLLAISMAAGAAIAVVRPWRLMSVGGIALAALKSSRVSNAALNYLADKARRN